MFDISVPNLLFFCLLGGSVYKIVKPVWKFVRIQKTSCFDVDLTGCWLCDKGTNLLAQALKSYNTLNWWRLFYFFSFHRITAAKAFEALQVALRDATLHTLLLDNNRIGYDGACALADALRSNQTLLHLNLNNNNTGSLGAQAFASALQCNTTLQTLKMFNNCIDWCGATAIGRALSRNCTLKHLDLQWNQITSEGVQSLADALCDNHSLQSLLLSYNRIGDVGARHLARALWHNRGLRILDLTKTDIGDSGTQALAHALLTNRTLHNLQLSKNKIGELGLRAMAGCIFRNTALSTLSLPSERMCPRTGAFLMRALRCNATLFDVSFSYYDYDDNTYRNVVGCGMVLRTLHIESRNFGLLYKQKKFARRIMCAYRQALLLSRCDQSALPRAMVTDVHMSMRLLMQHAVF